MELSLFEKLPVVQLLKNFPVLPCPQQPSTGPYPEPDICMFLILGHL
jgi:hypothetical protein